MERREFIKRIQELNDVVNTLKEVIDNYRSIWSLMNAVTKRIITVTKKIWLLYANFKNHLRRTELS